MSSAGATGRGSSRETGAGSKVQRSSWKGEVCEVQLMCSSHSVQSDICLFIQLCKSVAPSLVPQVEEEQRQFRKQMREGREREARQALLIHRLQNKVSMWWSGYVILLSFGIRVTIMVLNSKYSGSGSYVWNKIKKTKNYTPSENARIFWCNKWEQMKSCKKFFHP